MRAAREHGKSCVARATPRSADVSAIRDTTAAEAQDGRAARCAYPTCVRGNRAAEAAHPSGRISGVGMTLGHFRAVSVSPCPARANHQWEGPHEGCSDPADTWGPQAVRRETGPARRARALRRRAGGRQGRTCERAMRGAASVSGWPWAYGPGPRRRGGTQAGWDWTVFGAESQGLAGVGGTRVRLPESLEVGWTVGR